MHVVVAGIGRVQVEALAGVRADAFGAEADDIPFADQEPDHLRIGARGVLAGFVEVLHGHRVLTLGPVRAHQHPAAGGDFAVRRLPLAHPLQGQQKVRIRLSVGGAVDDAGRGDHVLDGNAVRGVVRQVAPRDPMDGRIEVGAGMLAEGQVVPVAGRAAVIVMGNLLNPERPGLPPLRRQHDGRELRRKRLRQIDHADAAAGDALH